MTLKPAIKTVILLLLCSAVSFGQAPPELQEKLNAQIKQLKQYGTDAQIVAAVKSYNSNPPAEGKGMTNDKWHSLSILDPFVRGIGKSAFSQYLKGLCNDQVVKIFVSGADGGKVGFNSKTEHWTHKGMPKHEVPMSGKTWIGTVKLDDSTGLQMIQVALPVLDGAKPIGSIVFGLRVDKLR
jgi:hypothetical protein